MLPIMKYVRVPVNNKGDTLLAINYQAGLVMKTQQHFGQQQFGRHCLVNSTFYYFVGQNSVKQSACRDFIRVSNKVLLTKQCRPNCSWPKCCWVFITASKSNMEWKSLTLGSSSPCWTCSFGRYLWTGWNKSFEAWVTKKAKFYEFRKFCQIKPS